VLIAYDLRFAADHFTGIGTHAYALLRAMLERPGDEHYAVLWNPRLDSRRYDVREFVSHPRVRWVERRIAPLGPLSAWEVGSWLRHVRPDVYLSPYVLLPEGARCPCVLTVHDVHPLRRHDELPFVRQWIYRIMMSRARSASAIVTSSEFSRREIVELMHALPDRVHAIRLGVPPRARSTPPRRPAGLPEGPFALVVGDNRPRKNLAALARAWARFGDSPPLRLVGAGPAIPRHPSLSALAARERAQGVTALGWVDEPELGWLYDNATLVLFPSLYEGFGFPLAEAFDRGLPAVVADIPTLREVGEGAATFVPAGDDQAWAESIGRIAADARARIELREAGLRRAAELDYRTTAAQTLALLREVARVDTSGGPR
jgi:glycosyltransferase involved in cell wall biosynthesis